MKNKVLIPIIIVVTVLVTLYATYLFQSGKTVAVDVAKTQASDPDYIWVGGFPGWLDGTFSGSGGESGPPVRRY